MNKPALSLPATCWCMCMPSWQGMAASTWQSLSVASHSHLRTHVQRGSHLSKAFYAWVDQEWWNHSHSRSHTPYKVTQLLQGKCRMPAGLVSLISVCLGQLTGSGPQWWIAESVCAVVVWIACFFFNFINLMAHFQSYYKRNNWRLQLLSGHQG